MIAATMGAYGRRRAGKVWRTLVPGLMPVTRTDARELGRGSSTTNLGHAARPADKSRINRRPRFPPPAMRATGGSTNACKSQAPICCDLFLTRQT